MIKKLSLLLFLYSIIAFPQEYKNMIENGTYTVQEIQQSAESYFENHDTGKGSGFIQYKRWEYFALRAMDENGLLKDPNFYFDELQRYQQEQNNLQSNFISTLNDNWTEVGPTYWNETSGWNSGVGRLAGLAVDESNQNHLIVGSIGGGIWKTTNKGANWQPLTDNHGNMYCYSLAMDQSNTNTYYWGSSQGRVYKSTDGGATWSAVGNAGFGSVLKILVDPNNSNHVLAAVRNYGVYRSTNGGTSWSHIIGSTAYDIEFDPNNSNIVFASGTQVYRSTNNGASFSTIGGFSSDVKMIGVTKADSNRVYIVEANGSGFGAFYQSTNNGASFTQLNHSGRNYFGYDTSGIDSGGQAPRDMGITVSPTNADEVHIAGILTWRSTDGGTSFSCTSDWVPAYAASAGIGYCHADVDDLHFVGNTLYVISDGGIFICENTSNVTANYYTDLTSGMGIRQFYLLGISQTDPVVISAGAQDNGTSALQSNGQWVDWLGADGFESLVDVNNSNTLYGTIYYGDMYKSFNQGNSYSTLSKPASGNWVTPIEQDASGTLYFGGPNVYKSTNGGSSWTSISQNLGGAINQLKIAPSNSNIIYASRGSNLYKTTTGSGTWSSLSGFSGSINSIAIHPTDPQKVAIATTGSQKVYLSSDGGSTWSAYGSGLPNFSAYALVWDNNNRDGLYLGMDYGIYYIDNTFSSWQAFNNNLPNVKVNELEINYADNNIYIATYGRGVWKSPRFDPSVLSVDNHELNGLSIYPNPANNYLNINWNENKPVNIRVFNTNGQLIIYKKQVDLSNNFKLDLNQLNTGIYFLKVNTDTGSKTEKIIKQ